MTHGSLFSGIGGFDLAAEWMGWENVFHCEWNWFCQRVLKYYWPNAKSYGDVDETDFTIHRGTIDVLSGGFPCQPYSQAGKRNGKEDNRHKWPEMLRAIREIQPRWVVGENVYGLVNWSGGLVFDEVQADLENEGYQVTPYILPACAVNAPHRRDRIWFVAHTAGNSRYNGTGNEGQESQKISGKRFNELVTASNSEIQRERSGKSREDKTGREQLERTEQGSNGNNNGEVGAVTNSNRSIGCEGRLHETGPETTEGHTGTCNARINERGTWDNFPTQSPIRRRNDGIPSGLVSITVPKKRGGDRILTQQQTFGRIRNESIKAYGNAIVPHVAYEIFKAIEQYEILSTT